MEYYSELQFAATFSGITALQLPTLISGATKGSEIAKYQSIGFPFNMSKIFMRQHLSFSPTNIRAGRYYTLVTSLFNHTDPNHLFANMMVLATSGRLIHSRFGRWHFVGNFIGGGIVGNLAMWLHYVIQKRHFQRSVADLSSWTLFKNTVIGNSLALGSSSDTKNAFISCIGCSASVSAVVSLDACITMETIITRLRQLMRRNVDQQNGIDFSLIYDLTQLFLALGILWSDIKGMFDDHINSASFFKNCFAYTIDRIGHVGHLSGFLFGVGYYFVVCRR